MGDWMEVDLENAEKHEHDVSRQSCGCIYCDLGLPILIDRSGPYHETYKHPGVYRVQCSKQPK